MTKLLHNYFIYNNFHIELIQRFLSHWTQDFFDMRDSTARCVSQVGSKVFLLFIILTFHVRARRGREGGEEERGNEDF